MCNSGNSSQFLLSFSDCPNSTNTHLINQSTTAFLFPLTNISTSFSPPLPSPLARHVLLPSQSIVILYPCLVLLLLLLHLHFNYTTLIRVAACNIIIPNLCCSLATFISYHPRNPSTAIPLNIYSL